MQALSPDDYAKLVLPDQWIEDAMQKVEAAWIIQRLRHCKTVLELGHGSGIIATALRDAGKDVTVVEGAEDFIGLIDGVEYVHALFEEYRPAKTYDCVIASFVLEHVADPKALLVRAREWSDRLIAVVGNAESWHRRVAVQMCLQPELDSLSERDKAVGHHRVYNLTSLDTELRMSGWHIAETKGIMFKPLNNGLLMKLPESVIEGFCKAEVPPTMAGNIAVWCYGT